MLWRMPFLRALSYCCLLALLAAAPARADDLSDFNAGIEEVLAHHRAALGYLVEDKPEPTRRELLAMQQAWGKVAAQKRPAVFDVARYTETMLDVSTRIVTIFLVLDLGNPDVARESLIAIRASLAKLRREAGVMALSDCVFEADTATADLISLADKQSDLGNATLRSDLTAKATDAAAILRRCDAMTEAASTPEFHALVAGVLTSLADIAKAIEARDPARLARLIDELGTFGEELALRYG